MKWKPATIDEVREIVERDSPHVTVSSFLLSGNTPSSRSMRTSVAMAMPKE